MDTLTKCTKNKYLTKQYTLEDVAKDPKSFNLHLSGAHDRPHANGIYTCSDEISNGKNVWTHFGGNGGEAVKLKWMGYERGPSWDLAWGGYSPEAPLDTPVPPESGYTRDAGSSVIKVRY
jgi:hypothetical protein